MYRRFSLAPKLEEEEAAAQATAVEAVEDEGKYEEGAFAREKGDVEAVEPVGGGGGGAVRAAGIDPEVEKRVVRKLDKNMVPLLAVLYLLAFLDRSNIGNARIAGLDRDLKLSSSQYQWLLTIFYISYIVFGPLTIMWKVVPPHCWAAACVLTWGIVSSAQAAAQNWEGMMALRFLMGAAEIAYGPGVPYLLSFFYMRHELGLRCGLFLSAAPLANTFAGALAYGITSGQTDLAQWRVLFLVEGLPTIVMAAVAWNFLPDSPEKAKFLTEEEKAVARARGVEQAGAATRIGSLNVKEMLEGFLDLKGWILGIMYFSGNVAFSSLPVFLPTILAEMGFSSVNAQGLTAPPFFLSFLVVIATCYIADKTQQRGIMIAILTAIGGAGYVILATTKTVGARYFGVFLAAAGIFPAIGNILPWVTNNQGSDTRRGTGIVILNLVGQCGPLLGTRLYPKSEAPHYVKGQSVCAGFMFLFCILALLLRALLVWENKQLDKKYGTVEAQKLERQEAIERGEQVQDTTLENYGPMFRRVAVMASNPSGPVGTGASPNCAASDAPSYAAAAASGQEAGPSSAPPKKKKTHRGGKKRRNRRQSFAAGVELAQADSMDERPSLANVASHGQSRGSNGFYRTHSNLSNTSLESEALLDHREQPTLRTRRPSVPAGSIYQPRASQSNVNTPPRFQPRSPTATFGRSRLSHTPEQAEQSDGDDYMDDRTPLMTSSVRDIRSYGASARARRASKASLPSPKRMAMPEHRPDMFTQHHHSATNLNDYDVNNPPSVPTSPTFEASAGLDDVMLPTDLDHLSDTERPHRSSHDALIDIDGDVHAGSPPTPGDLRRRMTTTALEDVCFPHEAMSEMGHEDYMNTPTTGEPTSRRRRRRWPDLDVLQAWAHEEKEQRTIEGMRMRKVSEPLMVEGRLRPKRRVWHREASDAPYRFTYFNETFDNTIHSQSISELLQPGQNFRNLFVPDPPVLDDDSDSTDTEDDMLHSGTNGHISRTMTRSTSKGESKVSSGEQTRSTTPRPAAPPKSSDDKPKRYGPRPSWWLDVMSPTETEMKVISKTFGIHPLTSEDILMQEQREKVELFKHYYFINYRTFEQDENSEDYLEPVNLYVVVFREGVISFHFSMTPHPANVRRRIRQLSDYLVLSPDWISYAIIDDITDAYAPMIQKIEEEVDDIDEAILRLHSSEEEQEAEKEKSYSYNNPHYKEPPEVKSQQESGRDMLRRVGECRKKVMSLYRLLGNKADVIKGFAKRCNEQWDIAPRNEIGMYLGDIQDHILTVLGTIVLPMNVVTGIWGMNCLVPGQDVGNLNWFWCITGGLITFGLACYFIAKRVYGIV
ncbi:family metal ion transporter [Pyrenophora seminiperda CCB06]|uniref:Family metal ion transporter n=1 Tax=Pyrenophora seminiperda CCB06 TaxID=1302712 RepID=A0A3M7MBY8_9PLEO|nr:family metal ion transporter [Pyrenophora seminiperda CCB06]